MVEHRNYSLIKIPQVEHPILEGVPVQFKVYNDQDFKIRFYHGEEITKLLTNDITDNGEQNDCGWTRTEGAGRVVYLSPGDPVAEHPFVRNNALLRLIANAIRWSAGE